MKRVILVAKAGGGKDFFRDFLSDKEKLDISYTTRPKREGEENGYTYNYIEEEMFLLGQKDNYFLEAVEFNGWRYGTSNMSWNSNNVFIMTPSGTKCIPLKDRKDCTVIYFDIPLEVRKKRLTKRSDADSVDRRIIADEKDFEDFSNFDIRITNPTYNCDTLYNLIRGYEKI